MSEFRTKLEIIIQQQRFTDLVDYVEDQVGSGNIAAYLNQQKNHLGIPIFYDALKTNNLEIISYLLAQGVSLSEPYNEGGYTPFVYACLYCQLATIELIVKENINVNQQTDSGITGFHVAAQRGNLEILEYLFNIGASPFIRTQQGETALLVSLKSQQGLAAFKWLLKCYLQVQGKQAPQVNSPENLQALVLPCLAYIIEKQQPDALEAATVLVPYIAELPDGQSISEYMSLPGNYSSTPLRSLDSTLASRTSEAIFSLLKAERLARKMDSLANDLDVTKETVYPSL